MGPVAEVCRSSGSMLLSSCSRRRSSCSAWTCLPYLPSSRLCTPRCRAAFCTKRLNAGPDGDISSAAAEATQLATEISTKRPVRYDLTDHELEEIEVKHLPRLTSRLILAPGNSGAGCPY